MDSSKGTRISINLSPNGKLNYVSDFQEFPEGDMSGSLNTRVHNNESNNVVVRSLVKGTRDTFDFSPEDAITQNAKFRFNFDINYFPLASYQIRIYTPNHSVLIYYSGASTITTIDDIMQQFIDLFAIQAGAFGQTYVISKTSIDADTGYVDLEITTVPYWSYIIETSTGGCMTGVVQTQIPVDTSIAGDWIPVASKDLNGDLFSLWTTVKDVSTEMAIVSGTNDGAGGYLLTIPNYTYVPNGLVVLRGTPIDGQYIVQIISSTTIRILGTTFTSNFTGGTIEFYPNSLSEFGVAQRDVQTGVWSYIRLVRTDQWNIRAMRQPEIGHAEDNIFRKSFYWNDHYNSDRVFYYKGAYIQDGAIQANNPDGFYNYATIGQETKLIQNNQNSQINFTGQSDSGGALLSGTYRYSGRFLSDDKTPTGLYLETTGQINVYSAAGNPSTIGGDEGGTPTGKVNNLTVTFDANLFRYFELIAIYYTGGTQSATLVNRVEISNGQTSINVSHSGSEPNTEAFDVGQLLTSSTIYDISKTLTAVDNFLVRSNMKTSSKQYDLSGFFKTFKHNINRKKLDSVAGSLPLKIGEYQVPPNMERYGGFMFFETYRIMGKVRYKNGSFSPLFWIDDIRIDFNLYNIDPAYPDNRRGTNIWFYSGFEIRNLNDTYIPYLDFYNYDLNFIVEGTPIGELIDLIVIERAEVVREVLSSGVAVMGVSGIEAPVALRIAKFNYNLTNTAADIGFYPYTVGNNYAPFSVNPIYPSGFTAQRRWAAYYSLDGIFNTYHSVFPNDQIISFGSTFYTSQTQIVGSPAFDNINDAEFRGFTCVVPTSSPQIVTIDDGGLVIDSATFSGVKVTNTLSMEITGIDYVYSNQPCLALHFTSDLNDNGFSPDYGVYQSYYYRGISTYNASYNPDTSKYGNRLQSRGVAILEFINTPNLSGVVAANTTNGSYGQDVFTQGTYMKMRAPYKETHDNYVTITDADEHQGYGGGMFFYSQNLVNSQMVVKDTPNDFNTWNFPAVSAQEWMYWWKGFQDNVPYDQSYGYINKPVIDIMFDSEVVVSQLPSTYFYSARKPLNSFIDPFRQFFPLNFVDENLGDGEIVHHVVVVNHIYGFQPNSFRRRFLNSNATLQPSNTGSEIIVGDGSVMAKVSEQISNIGCTNKYSVLVGRSRGGNDVVYWWNTTLRGIVRFGLDGTNPISFIHGIEPFVRNNIKWVTGKDYPAGGEGICCTWNDINKECIWTVKGFAATNNLGTYNSGTTYNYLDEVTFESFQFIALEEVAGEDPNTSDKWVKVLDDNENYTPEYLLNFTNLYTLVFSEIQNGFSGFRSFTPNIYFRFKDTYLSSGIDLELGQTGMYEHEVGVRAKYYGLQYDGFDQWVVAQPFNQAKNFGHNRWRTAVVPARVDYETNILNRFTNLPQTSYLVSSNFTARNGFYDSSIRWDASVSSVNPSGLNTTGKNGKLVGDYIKIKLTYVGATDQAFNQAEINFNIIPKQNNK